MKRLKYLRQALSETKDFLLLIEAYEEISSIRMRKVKKTVLSRREFMQGLNDAFAYIVYAYKVYRASLPRSSGDAILNTNGKTVNVFISANTGLYGDIIRETYQLFLEDSLKEKEADLVIVGKLGRKFYESSPLKSRTYTYFELSDNGTDDAKTKNLLDFVTDYFNVFVYHGVFKSILKQEAARTSLTGEVLKIEDSLQDRGSGFIFEPTVEKIAEYFEKQIMSLLFEQTIFESSLSKFASRMVSLDTAAENIGVKLNTLDFSLKKAGHKKINSGMQSTISGGNLWN